MVVQRKPSPGRPPPLIRRYQPSADPAGARARVFLLAERRLVRASLKALLAEVPQVTVIGEASVGPEAMEIALRQESDVVLVDVAGGHPWDEPALSALQAGRSRLGVILTSVERHAIELVLWAISGAARACLARVAGREHLQAALGHVTGGRSYLCKAFAPLARACGRAIAADASTQRLASLSHRERWVLVLAAHGHTNDAMASTLGISPGTARTHRHHLMDKLGIHNQADLVRAALDLGLAADDGHVERVSAHSLVRTIP